VSTESPPPRPGYLVVALLLAWFWGLRTAHEGYVVASIAVDPLHGDTLALPPPLRDAMVRAIGESSQIALPLGILQVILGGLLVVLSAVTLFRGRVSLSFMLQAIGANALLAVLAHALGAPLREAMIRVLAESPEVFGVDPADLDSGTLTSVYRWAFHLGLGVELCVLFGLALALTRPAAKAFLTAAGRAHEER